MTTKVKGTEGIEFPDSTVQGSAAYTKAQSDGPILIGSVPSSTGTSPGEVAYTITPTTNVGFTINGGNKYVPTAAGYYQVNMSLRISASSAPVYLATKIRKNGSDVAAPTYGPYASTYVGGQVSALVSMNGTTDYLEFVQDLGGSPTSPMIQSLVCSAVKVRN